MNRNALYLGFLTGAVGLLFFAASRVGPVSSSYRESHASGQEKEFAGVTTDRIQKRKPEVLIAATAFENWRNDYDHAAPGVRPSLIAGGVLLANARRGLLAEIAHSDADSAYGHMLSLADIAKLPQAVREVCEQPLSTIGSIDLRWGTSLGEDGELNCQHQTIAHAGDRSWKVNGAAYREARLPRTEVPIDGYVIDGELLIGSGPVRKLDSLDLAAASEIYPQGNRDGVDPVTGNPSLPDCAALIGGHIFHFENDQVINSVIARIGKADAEADIVKSYKPATGFKWLEAIGGNGVENDNPPVQATPFINDNINVLFIRVDFSDIPGAPVSQADLQISLSNTNGNLQNYSYGAAVLNSTVTSQLYRMPSPSSTYTSSPNGSSTLLAAARSLAAANYTLSSYDVVGVYFPQLSGADFGYSGLASVGGGDQWINGLTSNSSRVDVMIHEFGHNYGLFHANYWNPAQEIAGNYEGPGFASLDYGDIFDKMGGGSSAAGYFNPFATRRLNWLPSGNVVQATANGTWRVYRFDAATALSNPLTALRVPMGGNEYWWVGYRKLQPALTNSAYVVAEGLFANHSNLIDMTPNSQSPEANDRSDAGLPVGSDYYNPAKGVRFRTIASGGSAPNEWIDVQVEFDNRIEFTQIAVEVDEQSGNSVLTLRRSFGSIGVVTVNYATANGTAVAGSDYYASSGSVTWANGDTADKQILVPIRPDAINDGSENFTVTLSGAVGGTLILSQAVATVTLRDAGQRFTSFDAAEFNTTVRAIAPLADGKVLIGGNFTTGMVGNISRLNADGTEDGSFLKGSGFNGEVRTILVQSGGEILVGGDFTSYNTTPCNRFVRLNADGTVDGSFLTAMAAGANATVRCVAIEADGKILVGGNFTTFSGGTMEGLVRLTSAGARDISSPLTLPFEVSWGTGINGLITQDDGKIMVVGSFYAAPVASGFRSGVARLNANGNRDTSFDPDAGLHSAGATNTLQLGETILRQPDGKYIIGGGFTAYDEHAVPRIVRVNANGSYDSSFIPPAFNNNVTTLRRQPSGAIVVGGWFTSPVNYMERLLLNGAVDTTFQQGTGPGGSIYALASGADGALWVGGNFYSYDGVFTWPTVKVAGGVSGYDSWVSQNFTTTQINAGITDPSDDPDNDGIPNIAEMALGSSPSAYNSNQLFTALSGSTALVSSGPNNYLQASFARDAANPGVWVTAQFSADLTSWLPANPLPGTNATYDIIADSSSRFTVRDKTLAGPRRFVRFVARKPE